MRRHEFRRGAWLLAGLLIGAAACHDSTAPKPLEKPAGDLHFLSLATTAPALEATTVSFYAVKGQDREVRVRFVNGDDFLRFRVFAGSLTQRPDGAAIAPGDSILITITVTDVTKLAADFQPAGLKFSSSAPARLQFEFGEANQDLNGDGVVNAADAALVPTISVWRQEAQAAPWFQVASTVEVELNEVQADIAGFSGYALAY